MKNRGTCSWDVIQEWYIVAFFKVGWNCLIDYHGGIQYILSAVARLLGFTNIALHVLAFKVTESDIRS